MLYTLPLLGLQSAVTVSTSFAMEANHSSARWQEALDFPPAVPGSGSVDIVAGVGRWASVRQEGHDIDQAVASALAQRGWEFSDDLIAALVPPLAGAVYGQFNTSAHALLLASFGLLQSYTDSTGLQVRGYSAVQYLCTRHARVESNPRTIPSMWSPKR